MSDEVIKKIDYFIDKQDMPDSILESQMEEKRFWPAYKRQKRDQAYEEMREAQMDESRLNRLNEPKPPKLPEPPSIKSVVKSIDDYISKGGPGSGRKAGFGVYRRGGSAGEIDQARNRGAFHPRHGILGDAYDAEEEARSQAKRMNALTSPGEKKYYGINYHVKPIASAGGQDPMPPAYKPLDKCSDRPHTPIVSDKQRGFFGAELARAKRGDATKSGMSEETLERHLEEAGGKDLPIRKQPKGFGTCRTCWGERRALNAAGECSGCTPESPKNVSEPSVPNLEAPKSVSKQETSVTTRTVEQRPPPPSESPKGSGHGVMKPDRSPTTTTTVSKQQTIIKDIDNYVEKFNLGEIGGKVKSGITSALKDPTTRGALIGGGIGALGGQPLAGAAIGAGIGASRKPKTTTAPEPTAPKASTASTATTAAPKIMSGPRGEHFRQWPPKHDYPEGEAFQHSADEVIKEIDDYIEKIAIGPGKIRDWSGTVPRITTATVGKKTIPSIRYVSPETGKEPGERLVSTKKSDDVDYGGESPYDSGSKKWFPHGKPEPPRGKISPPPEPELHPTKDLPITARQALAKSIEDYIEKQKHPSRAGLIPKRVTERVRSPGGGYVVRTRIVYISPARRKLLLEREKKKAEAEKRKEEEQMKRVRQHPRVEEKEKVRQWGGRIG